MIQYQQKEKLAEALEALCKKFAEETGEEILIGYGMTEEGILHEGCTSSDNMDYGLACKLMCGITGYMADYYGNFDENAQS